MQPSVPRDRPARSAVTLLRVAAVALLLVGLMVNPLPLQRLLRLSPLALHEWLLVVAAIWTLLFLVASGRPRSLAAVVELLVWNGLFAGVAGLHVFSAAPTAGAWVSMLSLRGAVLGAWGFVVLGLPRVALGLRSRRRARQPILIGRWWFATVLVLGLLEPFSAVWEQWQASRLRSSERVALKFPEGLPPPTDGAWHLAAIGASTMRGWPYQPHSSIPQMAAWRLQPAASESATPTASPPIVIHNLAVEGIDLMRAITQLQRLPCRPHAVLLYAGHNEFYHGIEEFALTSVGVFPRLDPWLAWSPTFRLANRALQQHFRLAWRMTHWERKLIDIPLANEEQHAERLRRFRSLLQQLAEYGAREQIPMVWFVPAASEAGFEPNRSLVQPGTSAGAQQTLEARYQEARRAEQAENWDLAAAIYRQGLAHQPQFAEFHFRLGQCLLNLGQFDAARQHLALALEHDAYPVRALPGYREAIREVAAAHGVPIIDADAVLRPHTPHGILDQTVFLDDVHPTLRGQFLLGTALAEQLAAPYGEFIGRPVMLRPGTVRDAVVDFGLTAADLALAYERLAAGLDSRAILRFDTHQRQQDVERMRAIAKGLRLGELPMEGVEVEELE